MGFFSTWLQKLHETFIETQYWKLMLEGFGNTIVITLGALLIGVLIGTLIAVIKYCAEGTKALKPLAWICDLYVTVIRGVPVVVLLLIFYFIIMTSAEGITVGILTFGINSGAYMAELIRGGINSVDRGQMEAGRSLGMSKLQAMRKIIFPQALRYILPAIGTVLLLLGFRTLRQENPWLRGGFVCAVLRAGNLVRNNTYDAVNPLLIVAATYLILVVALTKLLWVFERRLSNRDHRK